RRVQAFQTARRKMGSAGRGAGLRTPGHSRPTARARTGRATHSRRQAVADRRGQLPVRRQVRAAPLARHHRRALAYHPRGGRNRALRPTRPTRLGRRGRGGPRPRTGLVSWPLVRRPTLPGLVEDVSRRWDTPGAREGCREAPAAVPRLAATARVPPFARRKPAKPADPLTAKSPLRRLGLLVVDKNRVN